MIIGTMNHPGTNVLEEIAWVGNAGFDFIDLTLEPPLANAREVNLPAIRSGLEAHELKIVGHTAYYLPLCCPFESIRRAAVEELKACIRAFGFLGATWMNLHPDRQAPFYGREFIIERNLQSIGELLDVARECGVGLMIENLPEGFNNAEQLSGLLEPLRELGLHLDIGHANLRVSHNTTDELLDAYGHRLKHVHLHDNKGGIADLHLPLGCGNINMLHYVRSLQAHGYDGTITLEVFTPDRHYLMYSREQLRSLWDQIAAQRSSVEALKA
jgi:sugar phosphate isomerase/epimerase